jgi:hypothetical protein
VVYSLCIVHCGGLDYFRVPCALRVSPGTSIYLAPELLEKTGRAATVQSDMYAFGLVLWCLFSGRKHAWMDASGGLPSTLAIALCVLKGERPDLTALRPDTPAAVTLLLERCWAQDPAARPDAIAVADEIGRWLQGSNAVLMRQSWDQVATEALRAVAEAEARLSLPVLHVHSAACNHAKAQKGAVFAAAEAGDVPGLIIALGPRTGGLLGLGSVGGGSTEEADEVSVSLLVCPWRTSQAFDPTLSFCRVV